MAERISDVPDDADWPELEDELIPEDTIMPDAGPYSVPFEYLHGARATLDADLDGPTRLLTVTAAKSLLRVAEETDTEVDPAERETFQRIAEGEISAEEDDIVEALAHMAAFVERHLSPSSHKP